MLSINKGIKKVLSLAYTFGLILLVFFLISSFSHSLAYASDGDIGAFDTTNQGQLPQALFLHTTVTATINGTTYIYVLGGNDNTYSGSSTVYKATIDSSGNIGTFDTTNQGQLPQSLLLHSTVTATINGTAYIYVLGGDGNSGNVSTVYKATIDSSGNIGTFDSTNQGQLPQALEGQTTVTTSIGGISYIYVLGGDNNNDNVSTVYKATIDSSGNIGAFDTTNQDQLPQAITNHSSVITTINNVTYIYVLGGNETINNMPANVSTVYKATIDSNGDIGAFDTTNQGQLPQVLAYQSTITSTINGIAYVYVLGGQNANSTSDSQSTVYKATIDSSGNIGAFDTTNQGQLPHIMDKQTAASVTIGGAVYTYVLGGIDEVAETILDTVYKAGVSGITPTPTSTPNSNTGSGSANPPVCSDQKPNLPYNLLAVIGPHAGQVTLSWGPPSGPVTDYSITYSNNPSNKLWGVISTGGLRNYTISNLPVNQNYYFWVNAVNGCMPGDAIETQINLSNTHSSSSSASILLATGPGQTLIAIGIIGIILTVAGGLLLII
jgi:hypothetical protein